MLKNNEPPQYSRLLAAVQQLGLEDKRRERTGNKIKTVPNYYKLKEIRRITSLNELVCTQVGFQRAYDMLKELLSTEEKQAISMIMQSVDFLCSHLEISYKKSLQPYNLFAQSILGIQNRLKRDIQLLDNFPQLKYIVNVNGKIFSPEEWYQYENGAAPDFCDAMLIRLFLLFDMNWEDIFQRNHDFFLHMEQLANQYCQQTVYYLKNMEIGEVLWNQNILQDNAAMLIKNTAVLHKLMHKFGMKHTGGSVVSLFC